MQRVTKKLVEDSNAIIGYTQSDEISLIFNSDSINSEVFFNGKLFKMTSILASMCTAYFNKEVENQSCLVHRRLNKIVGSADTNSKVKKTFDKFNLLLEKPLALFDCRVFQVPSKTEAVNYLIWRELDATRNSIQMAGQAYFSQNELHKKSTNDIQEMLFQLKDINWNNYKPCEKRGTYFKKVTRERRFSRDELAQLPEKHEAKSNPDLKVTRSDIEIIELPILSTIINRVDVIFNNAKPMVD